MAQTTLRNMPTAFTGMNKRTVRFGALQQKMMDLGWQLFIDDRNDRKFFRHKTYGQREFRAHTVSTDNQMFTFPIISQDEDPKGLGCSFNVHHGAGFSEIVSNEWTSFWDTRKGRRREHYLNYLDARMKKREQIQEEEAKNQAQLKKAYRSV